MTAAINLVKSGYEVTVYEKEEKIGGLGLCTPSVHMTPLDFEKMKDYIGFDVKPCFLELKRFTAYIYSKIVHFNPKYLFLTERGFQKKSLDSYLFKLAQNAGVHFEFSHPLTSSMINSIPNNSIIAVGTYSGLGRQLNLRCIPFVHFDGYREMQRNDAPFCVAYFDSFIGGYRYAYIAATDHLVFSEIDFDVHQSYKKYFTRFKKQLKEMNLEFPNWLLVKDYYPKQVALLKKIHGKTVVLAGAISGFHDPFFGFGVNSALVSGKIAAMTIDSKKRGVQEFHRFTSELGGLFILSKLYNHIPLRHIVIPRLFRTATTSIPLLGKNLRCIPGFTHEDCFRILTIE